MAIPVYSIVAFSGTGKTTVITALISELKKRGLRVAAVKHDAHDFEIDRDGKDSARMTAAGADVTIIASGSRAAVIENRPVSADELISRVTDVDVILTEGYKHGPWPKIALLRKETGKPLAIPPDECFAVMSDAPVKAAGPLLRWGDIAGLADLITKDIKNKQGLP